MKLNRKIKRNKNGRYSLDDHPMNGREMPGGCEDCNATQTLRESATIEGVWDLTIAHDETCPTYKRIRR